MGKLTSNITAQNVAVEVAYLNSDHNTTLNVPWLGLVVEIAAGTRYLANSRSQRMAGI
jgi:hypothetical protein